MTPPPERTGLATSPPPGRPGRLLLVGARSQVRRLARCLDQPPWAGLRVVGFVDLSGRGRQLVVHPRSAPVPILGRLDRLAEVVDRSRATDLVVALPSRRARRLYPHLAGLASASVRVHWVADGPARADVLRSRPRWSAHRPPFSLWWARIAKRLLDVAGAAVGLALLAPLFAVVSTLILLTSGRPIFYTQERIGRGGRLFRMWKFRSMRCDAEAATGPIWASDHDARCTPVGAWLRRTNIDELPQLLNVLLGQPNQA